MVSIGYRSEMLISGRRRGGGIYPVKMLGENRKRDKMSLSAVGPSEMHDVDSRQFDMVSRRQHQIQPQPSRLPTCQRCIPRGIHHHLPMYFWHTCVQPSAKRDRSPKPTAMGCSRIINLRFQPPGMDYHPASRYTTEARPPERSGRDEWFEGRQESQAR